MATRKMASKESGLRFRKIGRDSKTGKFVSVNEVHRRKSTTVVEKIRVAASKESKLSLRKARRKYDKALKSLAKK